ncbi:PREDICTED: carbohydrate sulfotransferase 11-like isoform X2 [Vollenhovia emeryi]|uniref:carbohydrate sulfotransferase 11-like isoform X2 n=1 Tax=Vollenhovia emeryi TaxID=411798 RepID=UPI0005F4B6F1|nr:PREDICTED: carbohydrate sulfotransferase 11-like isoform X2 [Vollenhovia emeryi]
MSLQAQFFKYGSCCIVLYFLVCILLIKTRRSNVGETAGAVTTIIKYQPKTVHFPTLDRIVKKNVESEINMLRMDELKGGTIDLQSAALLQQVSNVCAKYKLSTPLIKRHFLYNAKHKSLYCWIRKVASTSFTKLFSDMSNRGVEHNFYKEVDILSLGRLEDLQYFANNNTVFKLLVVRHPFQRLVSSYRDRIEDNSKYTAQSWLYAREILRLSRPELFSFNASGGNILQRLFLVDRRLKVVPSFREFLEWLLKQPSDRNDVHWAPYHTHCAVCNVRYNFILKLDEYTFGEVNYILSKLRLDKDKTYLPRLQRARTGATNSDITCKYFHDLTTDMVLRLYNRYKMDFEMYNYKLDKYLRCAKNKKLTLTTQKNGAAIRNT